MIHDFQTTYKEWSFPLRIYSVMWPNLQFPADLVTFTEEILNGKLHFLRSETAKFEVERFLKLRQVFQTVMVFLELTNLLFCRRCRHSKYRWYIRYFKLGPFGKIWGRIDTVGDRWCYEVGGNGKKVRGKAIYWKSFPEWSPYNQRKSKLFHHV